MADRFLADEVMPHSTLRRHNVIVEMPKIVAISFQVKDSSIKSILDLAQEHSVVSPMADVPMEPSIQMQMQMWF